MFEEEEERTDAVATGIIIGLYILIDTYLLAVLLSYFWHPDYVSKKNRSKRFGFAKDPHYGKIANDQHVDDYIPQRHNRYVNLML